MSTGFKAEDKRVIDIFTSSEDIRMPPYQRGYSWTEKEAAELLTDIREASQTERNYLLGAIVVVQMALPSLATPNNALRSRRTKAKYTWQRHGNVHFH